MSVLQRLHFIVGRQVLQNLFRLGNWLVWRTVRPQCLGPRDFERLGALRRLKSELAQSFDALAIPTGLCGACPPPTLLLYAF